jgi:hypothetical protein
MTGTSCNKGKNKSWLYYGIVVGFLAGLSYFVMGVYQHSHMANKHHYATNPGTTQ